MKNKNTYTLEYFDLMDIDDILTKKYRETREEHKIRCEGKYGSYFTTNKFILGFLECDGNDSYKSFDWEYLKEAAEQYYEKYSWLKESLEELEELVGGCEYVHVSY
tara:strand:- start:399 stop:716 length:318 start_codon:yes stop_codon:yes gene_type:complete